LRRQPGPNKTLHLTGGARRLFEVDCLPSPAGLLSGVVRRRKAYCNCSFEGSGMSAGTNRCPKCNGEMVQGFTCGREGPYLLDALGLHY